MTVSLKIAEHPESVMVLLFVEKHWTRVSNRTGCFNCYSAVFVNGGLYGTMYKLTYWERCFHSYKLGPYKPPQSTTVGDC